MGARSGRRRGHGEGSIYQRKDGRFAASFDLGHVNGVRKRKTIYGATRREVVEKLRVAQRHFAENRLVADERQTVRQYLDWWLTNVAPRTVRPSTLLSYEQKAKHINSVIGDVRLARLTPQHVHHLIERKLSEGLSPRGVAYIHAVLRRALGQAERWDLVSRNVARLVDPPRTPFREVIPLTPDEAQQLLLAASGARLEAMYFVALGLGLRLGEVLGLHWQDVNLDEGHLRVRVSLQRIGPDLVFTEPKSARSRRTIPLPEAVREALRSRRRVQLRERLLAGPIWEENDLVFATERGRPLDPRNVGRAFHRLCKRAGIGPRRFHDLRHTCASLLVAQGVHPRVVMEILGHSQISLTMNTYSHVLPSAQREAVDRLAAVLGVGSGE